MTQREEEQVFFFSFILFVLRCRATVLGLTNVLSLDSLIAFVDAMLDHKQAKRKQKNINYSTSMATMVGSVL
jgi:hypothetical protein